jgi:RTX calcium-binding nonapeptide repeat (4 copies)
MLRAIEAADGPLPDYGFFIRLLVEGSSFACVPMGAGLSWHVRLKKNVREQHLGIHAYYGGNWNNGESSTYDGYNITLSQLGSSSEDFHLAIRELLLQSNYENTPTLQDTSSLLGPLADAPNYFISDDSVTGGSGVDQLFPARGNDALNAGPGDDSLTGGSGDDTFVLSLGNGTVHSECAAGLLIHPSPWYAEPNGQQKRMNTLH